MVQTAEHPVTPVQGAKLWLMPVEAYHLLGQANKIPENTELLYGLVYRKLPKTPLHSFLLIRLFQLLQALPLRGFLIRTEQPLTLVDSEPEPDLAVVKGANEDFRSAHPKTAEIVIEICVTSHEYDRSKLRAYASGQVKECWLVLGPEKQIEVLSEPKDGVFGKVTRLAPGGILHSSAIANVSVELSGLFGE
jgi:hypothetical protein